MVFSPINKMDRTHSRNHLFLLVLVVVLDCGLLLGMPDGGLLTPTPVMADRGDDEKYRQNEDVRQHNQDEDEYYRDLNQLEEERERETVELEDEYNRELNKIEKEYQRDIAEEADPSRAQEKFQDKRNDLGLQFEEKMRQISKWYEEKTSEIDGR